MGKRQKSNVETAEVQQRPAAAPRVRAQRNELVPQSGSMVSFKAWFTNKLDQDSRIKPHHFDQLRLYMSGLGLGENESQSRYENGLRSYFGD